MKRTTFIDREGDTWEVVTDMLRDTETGRLMTRDEVEDFFGPLVETAEGGRL